MLSFEISEKGYIELNKLLKVMNLVETGGEAHLCIDDGQVKVNGQTEKQRRKKLRPGDIVRFQKSEIKIN
jgi:ribosome-associated protein